MKLPSFVPLVLAISIAISNNLLAQVDDSTVAVLSIDAVASAAVVSGKIAYQGFILHNGSPANGEFDFELKIYNALVAGVQQGVPHLEENLMVVDGAFSIDASFGSVQFWQDPRYIQVGVREGASVGAHEIIDPRAEILATPLALALPGVYANPNGSFVGIGRNFKVTAEEAFGVHSPATGTNFGGMYVNTAATTARPFFGYGLGGTVQAYHYFDGASQNWHLFNGAVRLTVKENGRVGIGELNPARILHVGSGDADVLIGNATAERMLLEGNAGSGAIARFYTASNKETVRINSHGEDATGQILMYSVDGLTPTVNINAVEAPGQGSQITLYNGSGVATVEIDADYGNGTGQPGRITVDELELNGADLAENFDIRPTALHLEPTPGFVVSIDPDHPGELMVSSEAYDKKVVGIISGAGGIRPGIYMSQKGTLANGAHPVAIAGRVYVMADASTGSISPGDQLTTSAIPGHAMKAEDHERARGAVLGKAMTALESGTGLVLVFVSQQ